MKQQGLGPGVQDAGEADLSSQVLRPEGHFLEGLRYGGEEQGIGLLGLRPEERVKEIRNGEDGMVVFDGQEVLLLSLEPSSLIQALAFWAVPIPTRVVRELLVSAAITLVEMAAQGSGAAVEDGPNDPRLLAAEGGQMIGILPENVGQLQRRALGAAVQGR